MKDSVWNILTAVSLLAFLLVAWAVITIFSNPQSGLNPFPPPNLPTPLVLPSATPTLRQLPPTWTATAGGINASTARPGLRPSSTPQPTRTGFTLATRTPTATITGTPTRTRTATRVPTNTQAPTRTQVPATRTNTVPPPPPTQTSSPTLEGYPPQ